MRQDQSTDQQIAEIQTYCQQHGLILRHKFVDVAKSGGSTVARDDFNKLIDNTRRPEDRPAAVLLWNYARFARDLDDAIYYKALLRNRNIVVHSLTDPIPEGQYGRIIEFFIDISNEEKRRQTSTDAKRGLRDLVLKYGCVPGTTPVGFKRQPVEIGTRRDGTPHIAHRWVPDPEMAPRIKRAFEMRAHGSSLAQILKETKLYTSVSSYKSFFTNSIYIGILEFSDLVIENYCEPMIDMQTWNTVQEIIRIYAEARTSQRHPRRANSPYILSGLVHCDLCGSQMFGNTSTSKGRDEAYRCSRSRIKHDCSASRISRRKLEEAVFNTLSDYILTPESLAAIYEITRTTTDHRETKRIERLAVLNDDKKTLSKKIANITRAIADRGHSQTLLDTLTDLETKRAAVSTEIAELTSIHFDPIPALTEKEVIELSQVLTSALHSRDPEVVRQFLGTFVFEIHAKKQDTEITGSVTYYAPPILQPPPFESAPTDAIILPISHPSVGAPLYRQTFTHPLMPVKRPSS